MLSEYYQLATLNILHPLYRGKSKWYENIPIWVFYYYLAVRWRKSKVAKGLSKEGNDGELVKNPKWVKGEFVQVIKFNGKNN